ncbi:MAG: hypothetical protein A2664_02865 [Candidatus Taylorbacteria bacterium RIFCSPHIGHO2_01_FULL_46_22b]|uniref:Glycosyltransferase 2-like domain-containing protein n=1 Tax=Candidatus Taylorbacteria bacterium RIFCSPHIGHO2_01_FULL_46_22b TaxID=1802301 RepID=A0A1G2M3T3_9BACT|nr:MAG: hypothetical protein A2664_02865 [Candidatus Taylorbacteria bacterium RIFCSPHIGHO2_01_FULL_46_22b]
MISFIIPTRNEEKVLKQLCENLRQYSGSCEIIVSDGNSTDQTLSIARQHADIVITHEQAIRQNISGGRNAGAKAAKGEYLIFIDADVTIPNIDHTIQTIIDRFQKNSTIVGITVKLAVLPECATWADKLVYLYINASVVFFNDWLHIGHAPGGEFQAIRSSAFKTLGGFDERLVAAEDIDMFRRLSKIGKTYFDRSVFVYHTARRAHAIGWPKLLIQWSANAISGWLFKRSVSKEWKVIR